MYEFAIIRWKVALFPNYYLINNFYFKDCVTPSIQPIKPFKAQDGSLPTPVVREVDEFLTANPKALQPHLSYYNNLYVYPIIIKFDGQKTFARVRFSNNKNIKFNED